MDLQKLDFAFPFIIFGYGAILLLILNNRLFIRIAENKLSTEMWASLQSKRLLAYFCFFVGGLWALQNIWFS